MRGREFTMKDAYSFDKDEAGAQVSYDRCTPRTRKSSRASGSRFVRSRRIRARSVDRARRIPVIADTGEDAIAYCPTSEYAANIELAEGMPLLKGAPRRRLRLPDAHAEQTAALRDVAALIGFGLDRTVKSIVLATDREEENGKITSTVWLLLIRGDHELNESRPAKVPGLNKGSAFYRSQKFEHFNCKPGYLGPINISQTRESHRRPHGGEHERLHHGCQRSGLPFCELQLGPRCCRSRIWSRTFAMWSQAILRPMARRVGDPARHRSRPRVLSGHGVFDTDESDLPRVRDGKPQPLEMAAMRIGVTRLLGAAIEQNNDDKGIIWPDAIAPFTVVICPLVTTAMRQ